MEEEQGKSGRILSHCNISQRFKLSIRPPGENEVVWLVTKFGSGSWDANLNIQQDREMIQNLGWDLSTSTIVHQAKFSHSSTASVYLSNESVFVVYC